ncbi:MAG: hypothetical protein GQ574_15870 [Crocinitomix sp.]|nr:hypothetical protein [Crocinitomix sp.]
MITPKLIGNIKSKEFHKSSCHWSKIIDKANIVYLNSMKHAIDHDFDPCGHCLSSKAEIVAGLSKKNEVTKSSSDYYFGSFYGVFNGVSTNDYSGVEVNVADEIELFATIHKCAFENGEWRITPVQNHAIDISCDSINFPTQQTNAVGLANWTYTIPQGFEPGDTNMSADFHVSGKLELSSGNFLSFFVPIGISNIRIIPNSFDQETRIYFKLSSDKKIKADIYKNTYFQNPSSHIKNLRNFDDGTMTEDDDDAYLDWDGTIDHGFRKGKPVMQGNYVVKIEGEFGESDYDYAVGLKKLGGIAGGTDPDPDVPTEYITNISFSPNPFSIKTKVKLNFSLEKDAKVSIHIQHISWRFKGECVMEIINDLPLKKGPHSYTWDGKNNNTNSVALGYYKVRILANGIPFVRGGLHKKLHRNL